MFPLLLKFAYHIVGSRESAEDAVQSVFLTIWMNRASWQPTGTLQAYLYRAVRNHALDTVRHGQLVSRTETAADPKEPYAMGTAARPVDVEVETAEEIQALSVAIRALPERQRTAMLLHWYDEMSVSDTAHVMGISRQAVEKLLRTAEAKLRTSIGGSNRE
jgi:RNA polymerase sigma-70 factor (ECF subfamily)